MQYHYVSQLSYAAVLLIVLENTWYRQIPTLLNPPEKTISNFPEYYISWKIQYHYVSQLIYAAVLLIVLENTWYRQIPTLLNAVPLNNNYFH